MLGIMICFLIFAVNLYAALAVIDGWLSSIWYFAACVSFLFFLSSCRAWWTRRKR